MSNKGTYILMIIIILSQISCFISGSLHTLKTIQIHDIQENENGGIVTVEFLNNYFDYEYIKGA